MILRAQNILKAVIPCFLASRVELAIKSKESQPSKCFEHEKSFLKWIAEQDDGAEEN